MFDQIDTFKTPWKTHWGDDSWDMEELSLPRKGATLRRVSYEALQGGVVLETETVSKSSFPDLILEEEQI